MSSNRSRYTGRSKSLGVRVSVMVRATDEEDHSNEHRHRASASVRGHRADPLHRRGPPQDRRGHPRSRGPARMVPHSSRCLPLVARSVPDGPDAARVVVRGCFPLRPGLTSTVSTRRGFVLAVPRSGHTAPTRLGCPGLADPTVLRPRWQGPRNGGMPRSAVPAERAWPLVERSGPGVGSDEHPPH